MVGLHTKEGRFLSSSPFSFYNSINRETMKFRIKIRTKKESGEVKYIPQVKKGFFYRWNYLDKNCKYYIARYYCLNFKTEAEAFEVIENYKKQLLAEEEVVTYKKL